MADLPAHIVALIMDMIAEEPEEPVEREDLITEGGLRIIRFLTYEDERRLAAVDRTARRMQRFTALVAWEARHPLHNFYWS